MSHPIKPICFLIGLGVLACWLAACQSTPGEAGATVALEPTAAAPTPTLTVTPVPPTPSPTATPVVEATPTPVRDPTKSAENVFHEQVWLSPDGQWRAHTVLTFAGEEGNVMGYQTDLIVSQVEGDSRWAAYSILQGAGLGYEVPTVLAWSMDGQSLFFTMQAIPDGCPGYLTRYYSGLHRLDLSSGEVVELEVSGIPSPDGTMVAQMVWEPAAAILIHHLNANSTTTYPLETTFERNDSSLRLTWSPDSQAVALEHALGSCFEENANYSLLYLNLTTSAQHTLIWQDEQAFAIADWPNPDEIYLREGESSQPVAVVNVMTGERMPVE